MCLTHRKKNPVATLATLILFSYTYLLDTVLDTFSFTILKYPNGTRNIVWLPDASVGYLQGKHIPLFLIAVVIVTIGLIYTVLLFSWQWLIRAPNVKIFKWIRNTKLNCFIEAYHAPYRPRYRYWTGLLLFIRVVLNLVNISGDPQYNLLATGILMAFLIMIKTYIGNKVYKNKILDYFENIFYFNLLFLTLATLYSSTQKISANISISATFVLFLCTILYHSYCTLSKITLYNRLCSSILQKVRRNQPFINHDLCPGRESNAIFRCSSTEVTLSDSAEGSRKELGIESEGHHRHKTLIKQTEKLATEIYSSNSLREPLLEEL